MPAVIVYTGGTTGEPKGVVLSNENINSVAHQYKMSGIQFKRGDTFFDFMPPFLGYGISIGMHLPISVGTHTILHILTEISEVTKAYIKIKPNHIAAVIPYIISIIDNLDGNMDFIKTIAIGGESASLEQEKRINEFLESHGSKSKLITGYGMTELSATVCTGTNMIYKGGTLGIPLPAVNIKIISPEDGEEQSYNKIGEICIESPSIMLGYYKNQQATDEIIKVHNDEKRWLHTGDLGLADKDGFVIFKGRIKSIYLSKYGGVVNKLFPKHIEELFNNHIKVKKCAVIVIPDEERINIPIAFVVIENRENNIGKTIKELESYAKSKVPSHFNLEHILIIDEMPLTQGGKVDYRELERRWNSDKRNPYGTN